MKSYLEPELIAKLNGSVVPTAQYVEHYEGAIRELRSLFERCILHGESGSCLLQGPKHCGKSTLIRYVLKQLAKDGFTFRYVILSGTIHSDDQLVMREIMQTAGLSNREEAGCNVETVLQQLKDLKSPLFLVLDEFELFAQRTRQSLLYWLFNACHSNQFPLVVLGETSRYNSIELLEKRVKSRFSQRVVSLGGFNTFESFKRIVLDWPFLSTPFYYFLSKDESVQERLHAEWQNTRNPKKIYNYFLKALYCSRNEDEFEQCLKETLEEDTWLKIAKELPPLSAGLLVCIKKLSVANDKQLTFESVYNAYRSYVMSNEGISPDWSVYYRAFEQLLELGFVVYAGSGRTTNIPKEFQPISLCITPGLIDEHFLSSNQLDLPTALIRWAKSE